MRSGGFSVPAASATPRTKADGTIVVTRHFVDGVAGIEGRYHYDDYGPGVQPALLAGHALVRPDVAHDATLNDAEKRAHAQWQSGASLNVPMIKAGRLMAILFVHYREAHPGLQAQVAMAEAVASRTWEAVERARAEAALRASEEKYRTLFTKMEEGFALCELVRDVDGRAVDYRWLEVNHALERVSGVKREQVVGRRASELLPDEYKRWLKVYADVVDRGEGGRFERESTQLQRWFEVKVAPHGGAIASPSSSTTSPSASAPRRRCASRNCACARRSRSTPWGCCSSASTGACSTPIRPSNV